MTYPYAATRCAICSASAVSCSARNATSRPTTSCDGTTDSSNDHSRKPARCFGGVPDMVFLGFLGVHHLYVGRGVGIFLVALITFQGFGFWWLADLFLIPGSCSKMRGGMVVIR